MGGLFERGALKISTKIIGEEQTRSRDKPQETMVHAHLHPENWSWLVPDKKEGVDESASHTTQYHHRQE